MTTSVSDTGGFGDFELLSAATHPAVCTQVIFIGPQKSEYQGVPSIKRKVKIRFEVPSERVTWTDREGQQGEGPKVIWATYTATITKNSKLKEHLESWRGRPFTEVELKRFDLKNILGKPCLITVTHNQSNGKTYANVKSITNLVKGMTAPEHEGELIVFDFDEHTEQELAALPDWIQSRVAEGKAIEAERAGQQHTGVDTENEYFSDSGDLPHEDIPF
jgi:hypothetical protein